ncbi:hypothetical protein [Paenibacillus nasutitermitis]|uniref:Uncharacterized protein n=1 Tax=Paenibacillus nasutitermitis TaxID=1652958 RepID=A0A916YVH4_9BACL|nr:hypothetical protein [Paenibacillus nasutitermitis]GGD63977.1 hypothetical protein GCM10010911_22140 [Paenibacillus nasutitermitis]
MAERSILAYFKSPDQAEEALSQIKSLKVADSAVDRIDGYPGEGIDHIENPITGDFPGLGYLTLGGDFEDRDAGILAATSVSASGYSSGSPENRVTGYDILLTVVIDEADYEKALKIVQDAGAL